MRAVTALVKKEQFALLFTTALGYTVVLVYGHSVTIQTYNDAEEMVVMISSQSSGHHSVPMATSTWLPPIMTSQSKP